MKSSRRSDTRAPLEPATNVRRRTLAFDAPSEEMMRGSVDPVSTVRKRTRDVSESATPPPYSGTRAAQSPAHEAKPHRKTLPPPPFQPAPDAHPASDGASEGRDHAPELAEIALDAKVAEVFARYAITSRGLRDHLQQLERLIPRTSEGAVLRMLADRMLCELYAWASSHLGWAYASALGAERAPAPPAPSPAMLALINEAIDGARIESASSPHYQPVFTALQKLDLELSRMIRLGHLLEETANANAS